MDGDPGVEAHGLQVWKDTLCRGFRRFGTLPDAGIKFLMGGAAVKHVYIHLRLSDWLVLNSSYIAGLQLVAGLCVEMFEMETGIKL